MYPSSVCTAASASARDGRGWSARTAAARNSAGSSSAGRASGTFASEGFISEGLTSEGLPGRRDLIKPSMSPPFDRPQASGVSPADGAVCRRTPESHNSNTTAEVLASISTVTARMAGLYFRHRAPYIGLLPAAPQGDYSGKPQTSIIL